MGLKGRYLETKIDDDHALGNDMFHVPELRGDNVVMAEAPALTAINERLRNDYREDCQRGVDRWNKIIAKVGADYTLTLPHNAFHRNIGTFQGMHFTPQGKPISKEEFDANRANWMPSEADREFVKSLMVRVTERGKMANWVAPPSRGVHGQDVDYEYVKLH